MRGDNVDLDPLGLADRREEIGVGKALPTDKERVRLLHHLPTRLRSEQTDRPRAKRHVVGDGGLAEQRLRYPGPELVGDGEHLVGRLQRAGADQHGDLLARRSAPGRCL